MSWHQRALEETDAIARFMGLWIACEALEPRLRDLFGVRDRAPEAKGLLRRLKMRRAPSRVAFPGLKALAEAEGAATDLVKGLYAPERPVPRAPCGCICALGEGAAIDS